MERIMVTMNKTLKPWLKKNFLIIVILGAIIAMAMSLFIGLSQSVWFDEAYSIMVAKKSVSSIINLVSVDVHPPFYYIILHFWGNIFGWSEFALRSLSVLAMGLAIVIAALITKKLFGIRAAFFALALIVFAPLLLRYGFEIRMYALASLIGILATFVLVKTKNAKNDRAGWLFFALYGLLVALGMFTLYYMALLWAAHLVWLIWQKNKDKTPLVKAKWFWSYILSLVLFSPWIVVFVKQFLNGGLAPIAQSMTVDNFVSVLSFNSLYRPTWQLGAVYSLVIIFLIAAISYFAVKAYKKIDLKQKKYLLLFLLYLLIPIFVLTVVGLFKPSYVERYLSHIIIGGLIFLGVVMAITTRGGSWKIKICAYATIAAFGLGVVHLASIGNYNFQRLQKPTVKSVASVISKCNNKNIIFAADPYTAIELEYYLGHCNVYFYSEKATLSGGDAPLSNSKLQISNPKVQLAKNKVVYYVYYDNAKLTMPPNLSADDKQTFGALTVQKFIVKSN